MADEFSSRNEAHGSYRWRPAGSYDLDIAKGRTCGRPAKAGKDSK